MAHPGEEQPLRQASGQITTPTSGAGLYEITDVLAHWLADQGIGTGLLTLFIRHSSASLIVQENADPSVGGDLIAFFNRLVPRDGRLYRHQDEGEDDMPAHIKAALTQCHLSIPVDQGRMMLGVWQGVYLFEHRDRPHQRQIALHLLGC